MNSKIKKILAIVLVVVVVITSAVFAVKKSKTKVISLSDRGLATEDVNLIAHRGFSAVAPENSEAAFIKAGEAKFFAAECDIQLTKDEIWVLNHDEDINKMTNGRGKISELNFSEIKNYKINGGNNASKYPDQYILTLDEYLRICYEQGIAPQIEIKKGNNKHLDRVLENLDWYDGMRRCATIISFDQEILNSIRELDNEIELWYLTHEITDEAIALCEEKGYVLAFNGNEYVKNSNGGVIKAQEKDIKLACWTIDNVETYKKLYDLGIRNFTTNRLTK